MVVGMVMRQIATDPNVVPGILVCWRMVVGMVIRKGWTGREARPTLLLRFKVGRVAGAVPL
jgi:hypothetical protein